MGLFGSGDLIIETVKLGPNRTQKRFVRAPKSSKKTSRQWVGSEEIDLYQPRPRYRSPSLSSDLGEEAIPVYRHPSPRRLYGAYSPQSSNGSIASFGSRASSPHYTRALPGPSSYHQNALPAAHSPPPTGFYTRPMSPRGPTGPVILDSREMIENPDLDDDLENIDWGNLDPPPPPLAPLGRRGTVGHGGRSNAGGRQYYTDGDGYRGGDYDPGYDLEYRVPRNTRGGSPGGRMSQIRYIR